MFEFTPKAYELMVSCEYRRPGNYRLYQDKAEECHHMFNVRKYYRQQFVCYTYEQAALNSTKIALENIAEALNKPRLFFSIALDSVPVAKSMDFFAVVHRSRLLPRGNKFFNVALSRIAFMVPSIDGNRPTIIKNSDFAISYQQIEEIRLPPPYSTACFDYDHDSKFDSKEACYDACVKTAIIKVTNKVPFTTISEESYKLRHVSQWDNEAGVYTQKAKGLKHKCHDECRRSMCQQKLYVTNNVQAKSNDKFQIQLFIMSKPEISVENLPRMTFSRYMVQFLSCISIWFSIDFTCFIPFTRNIIRSFE